MGIIRLCHGESTRDILLPEVCQVGRHWGCFAHLTSRSVPYFWLEIRWMGSLWAWRTLNSHDETRGSGALQANGWRSLRQDSTRAPRVSIGSDAWIEFSDLSPPLAFAQDVNSTALIKGQALEDLWECFDGRIHRFGWEESAVPDGQLSDGDLIMHEGRLYRVFCPRLSPPTVVAQLQISMTDCDVTIDLNTLQAVFESSHKATTVKGECVRVLAVYAQARRDEHRVDGGWLSAQEVYDRWVAIGGNPKSKLDRPGFERGKLRTQLTKQGALDVKKLYERQSSGYRTTIRLALDPASISIVGDELDDDD